MVKPFYFQLAIQNIRKNSKTQIPFILSSLLTILMAYAVYSLSYNEGLLLLQGGYYVSDLMKFGNWVLLLFSLVFLFYTYSFLLKNRKKELGLYNVLGMEKKHILRVLFYELLISFLVSYILGIILGIVFDKWMYLLIHFLLDSEVPFGFYVSIKGIGYCAIVFGLIYLIIYLVSFVQVKIADPIELLNSDKQGEKQPRSKWIITLLGLVLLGAGYWLALTIQDPIAALVYFFVAVILVVIGTYLLFSSGSISLLSTLKRNKNYYYKTNHFISISNMIYRMKQNAIGLANICILSTMVLVMLSTTLSLWNGIHGILDSRFPRDYVVTLVNNDLDTSKQRLLDIGKNIKMENKICYRTISIAALLEGDTLDFDQSKSNMWDYSSLASFNFFLLEDFNEYTGLDLNLEPGEAFLYSEEEYDHDQIIVGDKTYSIKDKLDSFFPNTETQMSVVSSYSIVVRDVNELQYIYDLNQKVYDMYSMPNTTLMFDSKDTSYDPDKMIQMYYDSMDNSESDSYTSISVRSKEQENTELVGLYSGFLFLGIFLSILFILAMVSIMYYKQINEGYQDKDRFSIMSKVGLDSSDIKRSINSQILTVFFLPLIVSGIHMCFAFRLICKLLNLLYFTDISLFLLTSIICFVVFAVLYAIVYKLTSKAYYRIVKS